MKTVMMLYYVLIGVLAVALYLLVATGVLQGLLNVQISPR